MIQLIVNPQGTDTSQVGYSGGTVLDLYDNEPIPLTLNVDDFTNVLENTASYSKPMKLPGTKKNNIFFNHIYEITADSNFNPHVKTSVKIKEGTIDTFEGYLQLNEILIKDGVISYSITLFSETVNVKDICSNKIFRDLSLSELNHGWTSTNVKDSWTAPGLTLNNPLPADSFAGSVGSSNTEVLKYPLVMYRRPAGNGSTPPVDFYFQGDEIFRVWINALYLLENIFRDAGYLISSNFLNSNTFKKLFIDFSYNPGAVSTPGGFSVLDVEPVVGGLITTTPKVMTGLNIAGSNTGLYDLATGIFTATVDGTELASLCVGGSFTANAGNDLIITFHTTSTYPTNPPSPFDFFNGSTPTWVTNNCYGSWFLDAGDTCWWTMQTTGGTTSVINDGNDYMSIYVQAGGFINFDTALIGYKGDTNQWDFVKGFIDMFNLIITPDKANLDTLIIEPYNDWVDKGSTRDWTNKVDVNEIKYKPIAGLSKTNSFFYVPDDLDRIFDTMQNPASWKWKYNLVHNIDITDADTTDIEIKAFSGTNVVNRNPGQDTVVTPMMLSKEWNTLTGLPQTGYFDNKMRILYDNGVVTIPGGGLTTYSVAGINPAMNNQTEYLQFTAIEDYPITSTSNSLRWTEGAEEYSNTVVLNSLYNVYWSKYIDELYHKDTKVATLVLYLTPSDLNTLEFNDIIIIKNKKFRIKKIDYRANALSKIELITIIGI